MRNGEWINAGVDKIGNIVYAPAYPGALFGNMTVAYGRVLPQNSTCELVLTDFSGYTGGYPSFLIYYTSLFLSFILSSLSYMLYFYYTSILLSLLRTFSLVFFFSFALLVGMVLLFWIRYRVFPENGWVEHYPILNSNVINGQTPAGLVHVRHIATFEDDNLIAIGNNPSVSSMSSLSPITTLIILMIVSWTCLLICF